MKLATKLLDERPTNAQLAILIGWYFVMAIVVTLWVFSSAQMVFGNLSSALLSLGRLFGLLATFFALTQFMLMGRVAWIEQSFGLDRLAAFHRFNGLMAIVFIVLHPVFIVGSYAMLSGQNYILQYISTVRDTPYGLFALISQLLFLAVVISSIYIARRHLKFETWYFVHLMVYAAIVLVPFHQFVSSPELAGSTFGRYFWLLLYGFVAVNLFIWRFALPVANFFRFRFRVTDVVAETPTTTSIYINADRLERLRVKPGQFVLIRILTPKLFLQEHPFSVSLLDENTLRLTIRKVGDYTIEVASLKPGAQVMVSGPFGRFTREVAVTSKRLFIAGGVGITPIRAMADEAVTLGTDSTLLYASRTPEDTPLKQEIDELSRGNPHLKVTYIYSDAPQDGKVLHGRVDAAMIEQLVPDFTERDVYLCGPPPMMSAIITDLTGRNLKPQQLHYERFSLHE